LEQELKIIYMAQKIDTRIAENERKLYSVPKNIDELDEEMDEIKKKIEQEKAITEEL